MMLQSIIVPRTCWYMIAVAYILMVLNALQNVKKTLEGARVKVVVTVLRMKITLITIDKEWFVHTAFNFCSWHFFAQEDYVMFFHFLFFSNDHSYDILFFVTLLANIWNFFKSIFGWCPGVLKNTFLWFWTTCYVLCIVRLISVKL